jgi:hypothetical protein
MKELVADRRTGRIRQAGAAQAEGRWVVLAREQMLCNLYYFAYAGLGLTRLTQSLHLPVCEWMTKFPAYRKMLLLPRDHLKTSIMRSLSIHMLMQDKDTNIYFPGKEGSETRILYAGETATNAEHQLSWIAGQLENNALLKGLFANKVWRNSRKESKRWNAKELVLPRKTDFPEASIESIGVGGAVTGRHYDVMQKDDLISFAAANSPIVMAEAESWHRTSRALLDDPDKGLEFIVGTHWSSGDLYEVIQGADPSVESWVRGAVEEGEPIFPEMFSLGTLARLEQELGALFPLLYMNSAVDPRLTDFKPGDLRVWRREGGDLVFEEDERDALRRAKGKLSTLDEAVGAELNDAARNGWLGKGTRAVFLR